MWAKIKRAMRLDEEVIVKDNTFDPDESNIEYKAAMSQENIARQPFVFSLTPREQSILDNHRMSKHATV